ncbi:hypothetical protein F4809DRAFT_657634 [Biscogniauxia mediterranea]|nr:hypothetical protein F4809DRAFT_657634 [Biscogniauxia mediterranea]
MVNGDEILEREENTTGQLSEPLVMMCQPTSIPTNPVSTLEMQCETKPKWNVPFPNKHRHNRERSLIKQARKSKSSSVDVWPLLDTCVPEEDPSRRDADLPDPLMPSPASAAATRRWSSVYLETQPSMSPGLGISPPMVDVSLDGPVSREGIEGIRHDNCPQTVDTSSISNENDPPSLTYRSDHGIINDGRLKPPTPTTESYLVTTNDIAAILDIVITGVRGLHDDSLEVGCQSLMFPKEPLVKPVPGTKRIVPPTPTLADPATTITSVQPCFSLAALAGTSRRYRSSTETLVWEGYHDIDREILGPRERSRRVSLCSSSHHCSTPLSRHTSQRVSFNVSPTREIPDTFKPVFLCNELRSSSAPIPEVPPGNRLKRAATTLSTTSCPKFVSRSCTDDWLTPLGLFGEQAQFCPRRAGSDLYNSGVDAHCGLFKLLPLPILEEVPKSRPRRYSANNVSFQRSEAQWSCQPEEVHETYNREFGRMTGISSDQLKSGVSLLGDTGEDPNESLLSKLRRYSFMPLLDQTPESIRGTVPPTRSCTEPPLPLEWERKMSSMKLLQDILRKSSPPSSKTSRSNSGALKPRDPPSLFSGPGRISCSEDTTPHICVDEQPTPFSERELDWLY